MKEFDLVVVGSGPAGYTGAIRAAQLGMKVACVEKEPRLGGTCLRVGCIPSKALLSYSEKYEEALKHFNDFGIETKVKLELAKTLAKKDKVVGDLCKGIELLFLKNKIEKIIGTASLTSANSLSVESGGKREEIKAKNILIATGSQIVKLPGIGIDEEYIVSSTGALNLKSVPRRLVVIGGGYIGLELGSVWRRFGSEVTVVEYFSRIVPSMDLEIGNKFFQILQKQGIGFKLDTKVSKAEKKKGEVILSLESKDGSSKEELVADVVLVSAGRKPYTEGLGLAELGIGTDSAGRININESFQTSVPSIYAVGDAVAGPMLAHKAEEEAIAAVEIIAGQKPHINYALIPSVVYTSPEVASVGATEEELKERGVKYKVGKFPFLANSRARASGYSTDGLVKILADSRSDEILGAHIIGPEAGNLIAEIVAYMEFGASAEDIARTCHAHPTLNEAVREAALGVAGRSINI